MAVWTRSYLESARASYSSLDFPYFIFIFHRYVVDNVTSHLDVDELEVYIFWPCISYPVGRANVHHLKGENLFLSCGSPYPRQQLEPLKAVDQSLGWQSGTCGSPVNPERLQLGLTGLLSTSTALQSVMGSTVNRTEQRYPVRLQTTLVTPNFPSLVVNHNLV